MLVLNAFLFDVCYESHNQIQLLDKPNFYPLRAKVETILLNTGNKYKVCILPEAIICNQIYAIKYMQSNICKLRIIKLN